MSLLESGSPEQLIGHTIHHYTEVESTNTTAGELAERGVPEGTVVLADLQTRGQGRLERRWLSLSGKGLWFTVILRPRENPATAVQLTLMAAIATAAGIERVTGIRPGIKWPNDLLVQGKKVCGILCEMVAGDEIDHIIIGIGINTNLAFADLPPELRGTATSLRMATGKAIDNKELLREVLQQIDSWYILWQKEGFAPVQGEWNKRNVTLGREIKVDCGDRCYFGRAVSIDENGALLLREDDGKESKFNFGEVSIRYRE